jgi:hypothetical protein
MMSVLGLPQPASSDPGLFARDWRKSLASEEASYKPAINQSFGAAEDLNSAWRLRDTNFL